MEREKIDSIFFGVAGNYDIYIDKFVKPRILDFCKTIDYELSDEQLANLDIFFYDVKESYPNEKIDVFNEGLKKVGIKIKGITFELKEED